MEGGPHTGDERNAQRLRRGRWAWIGAGADAAARGVAFCALMLAGFCLVLALLLPLFLAGLGISLLVNGPDHGGEGQAVAIRVAPFAGLAVSLLLIPAIALGMRQLAILTRRLCGQWCAVSIADPYRPAPRDTQLGLTGRMRWRLGDPAGRRDALWFTVNASGGWVLAAAPGGLIIYGLLCLLDAGRLDAGRWPLQQGSLLALGNHPRLMLFAVGLACIAFGLWAAPWLLRGYGMLARTMLAPSGQAELALRVAHLAQTRADTIDTGAAELRRIERDLHDGAQARLVAMGMTLDAAGQLLDDDPSAVRALLAEARESSAKARPSCGTWCAAFTRRCWPTAAWPKPSGRWRWTRRCGSISPANCGAGRPRRWSRPPTSRSASCWPMCPSTRTPPRPGSTCGTTARCCGSGSPTTGAAARIRPAAPGCAASSAALAAFDGVLAISSPPGGPTVVNMEIPCALSSPKTTSC